MWYEPIQSVGRVLIGALWIVPVSLLLALVAFVCISVALFVAGSVLRLRDVARGKLHDRHGPEPGSFRKIHLLGN